MKTRNKNLMDKHIGMRLLGIQEGDNRVKKRKSNKN
jgi:hypothetical protein